MLNMLPNELLLLIAEINPTSFAAIRSVSKDIRNYTNEHMDKYKKKFLIKIEREDENGYRGKYFQFPNGDYHGLFQIWCETGQLLLQCTYNNGVKHGLYQEWHKNGQLETQFSYLNGKIVGIYQKWYDNGQLDEQCNFENGKRNGLHQSWLEDGRLEEQCIYINGNREGLYQKWSHDIEEHYKEGFYVDGKLDGSYRWYDNGLFMQQVHM